MNFLPSQSLYKHESAAVCADMQQMAIRLKQQRHVIISKKHRRRIIMEKWVCEPCGYVYDPEVGDPDNGIEPGTAFEDLPDDWVCPVCGVDKTLFEKES